MPLIQYLTDFWTPDSEYARFKRNVKKKLLSAQYIENNHEDIRRHVEPFPGFAGITVGSLTKAILKKWLIWLSGRKTIRRKKDGTVIVAEHVEFRPDFKSGSVAEQDNTADVDTPCYEEEAEPVEAGFAIDF